MKTIMIGCAVAVLGACAVEGERPEAATSEASQAVTTTKFQTSFTEGSADIQYGDWERGVGLMLFAQRSTAGGSLFFDLQTFNSQDPMSVPVALRGWGPLPGGALVIGADSSSLNVTLGTDFYVERCSWTWGFTCEPVSERPTINLTWTADDWFSSYRKGTEEQTFQNVTMRTKGTYWIQSARAEGVVAGVEISNASAMMHDSKGQVVTRELITTTP